MKCQSNDLSNYFTIDKKIKMKCYKKLLLFMTAIDHYLQPCEVGLLQNFPNYSYSGPRIMIDKSKLSSWHVDIVTWHLF